MPRSPRMKSTTGMYHVVFRGNGKQTIFETDKDRRKMLSIFPDVQKRFGIEYVAWCLMSNHVHLVVLDQHDVLSAAVGSIQSRYAQYYNRVHGHCGHVFQKRFFSEPIESESYLLAAVRYVHNNPVRIGLCQVDGYLWSSYREYTHGATIVNPDYVMGLVGGVDGFVGLSAWTEEDSKLGESDAMPGNPNRGFTDEEAMELARAVVGVERFRDIARIPKPERDRCLCEIVRLGITVRQAERITGIGHSIIARAASLSA